MIPGTIAEWKKELEKSEPGEQRGACVYALLSLGVSVEINDGDADFWRPLSLSEFFRYDYRVKPVLRDWTAEDARKHVGFVARKGGMFVIVPGHAHSQFVWADHEYAAPIPGADPATWDWKPCKVEVPAQAVKPPYADAKRVLSGVITALGTIHPGEFHKFVASVLADLRFVLSDIEQESP